MLALAAAGLLLVPATAAGDPLGEIEAAQQKLFARVAPAVVFIVNRGGIGSGFFVAPDGLVLTNAHVVRDAQNVDVILRDGRRLQGRVVQRADDKVDLALVKVSLRGAPTLALAQSAELRIGSWVGSVGHGMGGAWAFTTGMITNIYPLGAERPVFQTQIPLNPGNSGGPVFDRAGRVLGIVVAGIKEASSINFAIRASVAARTLPMLAAERTLTVTAPRGVQVFVDGRLAGKGPRVVIVAEPRVYDVTAVVGGKLRQVKVEFPATRAVDLR